MEYLSVRRAADRLITPQQIAERIDLFSARIAPLGVEVERVESSAAAASLIAGLASEIRWPAVLLSSELVTAFPGILRELENQRLATSVAADPAASVDAPLGVTLAHHAIAETGSVVLSEPDLTNRSVGLLSLVLVVIVPTGSILASLDEVTAFLRSQARRPGGAYTTLLTGPSRTADIEMSLTVGVQGPGRVLVMFVDKEMSE